MIGAIIGDIVGSVYERNPIKTKEFELFKDGCRFTDDTVMTCAVCYAVREYKARPNVNVIGLFQKRMVELVNAEAPDVVVRPRKLPPWLRALGGDY